MPRMFMILLPLLSLMAASVMAQEVLTVKSITVQDEKAVFATVESVKVVTARARLNGTVIDLEVREGDLVTPGQVIARVVDEKLALQIRSLEAHISSLRAQFDKAGSDLARTKELISTGAVSKARLDEVQAQYNVAEGALKAGISDRDVIRRQACEGEVLAPVAGRILSVPLTVGTVVMPGEVIASVARENYVLRLSVPERYGLHLKKDDLVRLEDGKTVKILTIYPKIEGGRVTIDADINGLESYFVGERVRVWISGGERRTVVIPDDFITTRFGIDHVRLRKPDGSVMDVPVQRGTPISTADIANGIEIISGLHDGDVLEKR
ncbi:efflux RND transporter periplasmic adaptor subunit [Emcibacter sp.]|uniref:efflux RND transporter periplasmic adaptor subunit n=1 Tax=Emcibacter sp. TaxID=1979954 RepID=UPI002AA86AC8|nr:efflux RND transporter periplasmic adaptor subunit [Emcibacter sp.]